MSLVDAIEVLKVMQRHFPFCFACLKSIILFYRKRFYVRLNVYFHMSGRVDKLVNDPTEGNAWHADHIVPVFRGGGKSII